ncbi:hypothetical protein [Terracidiphilus gabretensis]|uniref:hypothetical protein n=1 Tax=Terracidiphilus gabretensis TaxID=1577687 RepID=UPI00071C0B2E|nr:hypothetical protein [Terracidiphilus gabretensis]
MKSILILMILSVCSLGKSQTPADSSSSCPSHITVEILQQNGHSVYQLQQKTYPKYPLDVVGRLMNRCSKISKINIIVDSDSRLDDVITAINGAGKDQIDQILIFLKAKNGLFYPVTIGEHSVPVDQ